MHKYTFYNAHFSKRTLLKGGGVPCESLSFNLPVITLCVGNMEQVNWNLSLKNIPFPSRKSYLFELINSTASFAANLSWKVYFFLNPTDNERKETFGFRTTEPAPFVVELKDFYDDLFELVNNVRFKRTP